MKDVRVENIHTAPSLYTPIVAPSTKWDRIKHKFTTKDGWIGNYDYRALWYFMKAYLKKKLTNLYSMPRLPFIAKRANKSPFYGPDDDIPILVIILMGIQRRT